MGQGERVLVPDDESETQRKKVTLTRPESQLVPVDGSDFYCCGKHLANELGEEGLSSVHYFTDFSQWSLGSVSPGDVHSNVSTACISFVNGRPHLSELACSLWKTLLALIKVCRKQGRNYAFPGHTHNDLSPPPKSHLLLLTNSHNTIPLWLHPRRESQLLGVNHFPKDHPLTTMPHAGAWEGALQILVIMMKIQTQTYLWPQNKARPIASSYRAETAGPIAATLHSEQTWLP